MIEAMTTATRTASRSRWALAFLAAVLAVAVGLFTAAPASALAASAAETRVGASHSTTGVVVGSSANITAGQQLGNDPPRAQMVVATGVAAETAGDGLAVFRTPRVGMADEELGSGLNPANHAVGDRSAYVGSESVARDFADPKVGGYANGSVRYQMQPAFEEEFSPFRFRYDGGGSERWEYQIPQEMIPRFNELTSGRTWAPW